MPDVVLVRSLRSQSTWRLLALGLVTYGVYYAYYIARQTQLINAQLDQQARIPRNFVIGIFFFSYAALVLFFGYLLVDDNHPVAMLSKIADRIWIVLILIWGFYARNRLNSLNAVDRENPAWFHGLWTFLFSPLYFNYKVNVLNAHGHEAQAIS